MQGDELGALGRDVYRISTECMQRASGTTRLLDNNNDSVDAVKIDQRAAGNVAQLGRVDLSVQGTSHAGAVPVHGSLTGHRQLARRAWRTHGHAEIRALRHSV
jgi:hypothetical protein